MDPQLAALARRMRRLEAYAAGVSVVALVLVLALAFAAFRGPSSQKARFTEIDVERVNIVEPDGKLRLTLSNSHRLPDPVIGGKAYPLRGGTGAGSAGLVFFNDEGNENGGLVSSGKKTSEGHRASAHLTFDQFDQDEALALSYQDVNGARRAGLTVADRSEIPVQVFAESVMAIRRLPEAEQARRMEAFRNSELARASASRTRLYAGKTPDRSATVVLSDPQGRPRLRLAVDSLGKPSNQLLDASGKVQRVIE
jgi:hypothetical protein